MKTAMLPDYKHRNELKFYVAGIPYHARLMLIFGLWGLGLSLQVFGWVILGAVIIFIGTLFALTHGYSNEPARRTGGQTRWENVTLDQFNRVMALDEESRRWDRAALIDATNVWGFLIGAMMLIVMGAVFLVLQLYSVQLAALWAFDGASLLVPFWLTGIRRVYHRTELMIRVRALRTILQRMEQSDMKGLTAAPLLELQKTPEGDLPTDAKLMVRVDGAPENFIGIQVQVSLNNVQGTKYPYLYCVILAKPGFGLNKWRTATDKTWWRAAILAEPGNNPEVELLVVRQKTTKNSGYHTNAAAQCRVFEAAVEIVRRNLARSSK